jgi:16S rRNA (adenine1518-N6/adenine1519-N6)-dimethyltransferase
VRLWICGIKMSGIRAAKHLGQHFLVNPHVISRIVDAIGPELNLPILEIGPGTGALTKPLLQAGAHVVVFEMDERCWPTLHTLAEQFKGQLTVIKGDALEHLPRFINTLQTSYILAGNLPYNVGTEMVVQALQLPHKPQHMAKHMIFMLQKEVVQRICPQTPSQQGRLGVLCNLLADCKKLFDVPPGAFSPPPKVMSSMVKLTPLPQPRYAVDFKRLDILLRTAFGSRRKMLRASLKGHLTEAQIAATGISPTARPEELRLEQLCLLANML